MTFFGRVLASLLEHRRHSADVFCLTSQGVRHEVRAVAELVTFNEANCLIYTEPFESVTPKS